MPLHSKDTRKSASGGGGGGGKGKGKGKGKGNKHTSTSPAVKMERAMQKQTKVDVGDEEYEVLLKLLFDLKSSKVTSQVPSSITSSSFSKVPPSLIASPLDIDEERAARYNEVKQEEKAARKEKKEKKKLLESLISEDKKAAVTAAASPSLRMVSSGSMKDIDPTSKSFKLIFETPGAKLGKSVRLQLKAENSKGNTKVVVIPRSEDLSELFVTAKNKLKMKKIGMSAYVVQAGKKDSNGALYLSDTLFIKDDVNVTVSIEPREQEEQDVSKELLQTISPSSGDEDPPVEDTTKNAQAPDQTDDGTKDENKELDNKVDNTTQENIQVQVLPNIVQSLSYEEKVELGNKIKEREISIKSTDGYRKMLVVRDKLPATGKRGEFIEALESSNIIIIAGETGSGKTTQIPQFILDHEIEKGGETAFETSIVVTQPRRVSAVSVAKRVAQERDDIIGERIGYQVRFDSRRSKNTKLLFCTTGILLRRLVSDRNLEGLSHVIVDEVHERDIDTDFLLILLRELVSKRTFTKKPLKLLLMSATAQVDQLVDYMSRDPIVENDESLNDELNDVIQQQLNDPSSSVLNANMTSLSINDNDFATSSSFKIPKVVEISGRTFPVSIYYLEDIWKKLNRSGAPFMKLPISHQIKSDKQRSNKYLGKGKGANNSSNIVNNIIKNNTNKNNNNNNNNSRNSGNGTSQTTKSASKEDDESHQSLLQGISDNQSQEFNGQRDLSPLVVEPVDFGLIVDLITHLTKPAPANIATEPLPNQSACHLKRSGAILVFLPGVRDIEVLMRLLRSHNGGSLKQRCHLLCLHGSLPIHEQRKVFQPVHEGIFKVVVSTNVAESSITIDDVVHVIDSGHVKETRYDPHSRMQSLETVWCCKDSCKQRAGRAGRTSAGMCWRLFPKQWFEQPDRLKETDLSSTCPPTASAQGSTAAVSKIITSIDVFKPHNVPEMCRTPLEGLVLQVSMLGLDPRKFLSGALNPPQRASVISAIKSLIELGALKLVSINKESSSTSVDGNKPKTKEGNIGLKSRKVVEIELTPLGNHLARLPLDARLGKLLVLGCCFGCRDACLTVGAALSHSSPFLRPWNKETEEKAKSYKNKVEKFGSDHIAIVQVFNEWLALEGVSEKKAFCHQHVLSYDCLVKLAQLRDQFRACLSDLGFCSKRDPFTTTITPTAAADDDDDEPISGKITFDGEFQETYLDQNEDETNLYGSDVELIRLVICAALYPNLGRLVRVNGMKQIPITTRSKENVFVHPSSINLHSMQRFSESKHIPSFICYHSCLRTSKAFLHDTTFVSKYAVLLFASGNIEINHVSNSSPSKSSGGGGSGGGGTVVVDGWIELSMPVEGAVLCKLLRLELDTALRDMIKSPDTIFNKKKCSQGSNLVNDQADDLSFIKDNKERNETGSGDDDTQVKSYDDLDTERTLLQPKLSAKKKSSTALALAAVRRLVQLDSYKPPQYT